jgi:RND family efflux transporter MFP subunit
MSDTTQSSKKVQFLKAMAPPAVLLLTIAFVAAIVALRPEQEKKAPQRMVPSIETVAVTPLTTPVTVRSQGTVTAPRTSQLSARIGGHLDWISQNLFAGGQFSKDEVLLKIDPVPYAAAVARAEANLANAQRALLQEQESADQAEKDWIALHGPERAIPSLVARLPQLEAARAEKAAAEAALQQARIDLFSTEVRAPYDGRVLEKGVDVGQAVAAGSPLARIYAGEILEVALPLTLDEVALLDDSRGDDGPPIEIQLHRTIGGIEHQWNAVLQRREAQVNPASRLLSVIARVIPPGLSQANWPLLPGMFVTAEISGPQLANALQVPRSALQPGNRVYRLSEDTRLEEVVIDVRFADAEVAIIESGLAAGDRLCITPLLFFVDGMEVNPAP